MRLRAAVAVLAVALPLSVMAGGYDKTTWGMSLAQVQKLYPGGKRTTMEGGCECYSLRRKAGTYDAITMFNFYGGRLTGVVVQIPKQKVPVNRKACTHDLLENEEAKNAAEFLRAGLEVKYGRSRFDHTTPRPGEVVATSGGWWWVPAEKTSISLFVKPQPDGVHMWVGIMYSQFDSPVLRHLPPERLSGE